MAPSLKPQAPVDERMSADGADIWYLETALGFPFTYGNRVEIFRNGDEIFPAMLEAIEAAERTINFATYVYWTGDIAVRFAETLAKRARSGVATRVLLDAFGANKMSKDLIRTLREAGVDVRWFRPFGARFWDYDKRTHRKLLVCDQEIAFTGGVGIAKEWEGDARGPEEWRETHFAFRGPSARYLEAAFWDEWFQVDEAALAHLQMPEKSPAELRCGAGQSAVQVALSSPSSHQSPMDRLLFALTRLARRRIRMVTPYLVLDDRYLKLLAQRAREGVDIEIMIPGEHTDRRFIRCINDGQVAPLLDAGIRVWRYQPTMIHAKIWLIDDDLACVGSPNLNQRSRKKDDEVAAVIKDPAVVAALDAHFEEDLRRCDAFDRKTLKKSLHRRIIAAIASPFQEQF